VTKDLIKETLHDALHVPGEGEIDQAWSRRLGGASMELMFALAARAGDEVHCACPAEVAVARYNARSRHEVHTVKQVTLAWPGASLCEPGLGGLVQAVIVSGRIGVRLRGESRSGPSSSVAWIPHSPAGTT
jgi:hypothetical protein